jgi:hypothetical protein
MIRPIEPRVSLGKERHEEFESFGKACLDKPMPGKTPYRKVPGVKLGELAYVEGDALRRFRSAENFAVSDGVLTGVLRYDVV